MAVGGEEGDDEWELDDLFRTIHVDLREEGERRYGFMRYTRRGKCPGKLLLMRLSSFCPTP